MSKDIVNVFILCATLLAIFSLTFVAIDMVVEIITKRRSKATVVPPLVEQPVPVIVPIPEPEPEPIIIPEVVESIDAEQADELMSDSTAIAVAMKEKGAHQGAKHFINLGVIDKHFSAGDTVTIESLKAKGLVNKNIQRIKILADGTLTKPLTVKAEGYSIQAIKMIELTGGTVIILE